MKHSAARETCIHDSSIWIDRNDHSCVVEKKTKTKLGYPSAGYECKKRVRVPGSDDDLTK